MSYAAAARRRGRGAVVPPPSGTFAFDVWPYQSGSGDAWVALALPQGDWPSGSSFRVTVAGVDRAAGLTVTTTHPDGSLRTGALRVDMPTGTAGVLQPGTITLGTAGPSQAWVAPTFPSSFSITGTTTVAQLVPCRAVGGITNATKLCASGAFGPLIPRGSNPSIPGVSTYETVLDRLVSGIAAVDSADANGADTEVNGNTWQYDRAALLTKLWARTGNVAHLALAVQYHAAIACWAGNGANQWKPAETWMAHESALLYMPQFFADDRYRAVMWGSWMNDWASESFNDWWVRAGDYITTGNNTFTQGRWQAHHARTLWAAVYAGAGSVTVNGRTRAEWLRDWSLRVAGSNAWAAVTTGQRRWRANQVDGAFVPDSTWHFHTQTMLDVILRAMAVPGLFTAGQKATLLTPLTEYFEWLWTSAQTPTTNGITAPRLWWDPSNPTQNNTAVPDLIGFYPEAMGRMFVETGDPIWRTRGDTLLAEWTDIDADPSGVWQPVGSFGSDQSRGKVMQETFTTSQHYLSLRGA